MNLVVTTVILGVIALILWLIIINYSWHNRPMRWFSPISLFGIGVITFYIVPPIYWQFSEWEYTPPPYFDGLPLVLTGAVLLGIPFLLIFFNDKDIPKKINFREIIDTKYVSWGNGLWLCIFPAILGMSWRIYLLMLGFQSRLARSMPTLFGSEPLAYIFGNVMTFSSVFYFAMILLGNKRQRRIGIVLWICDGFLQMITLHRYAMLIFALNSVVFMSIMGIRMSKRKWLLLAAFVTFTVVVIGKTAGIASQYVEMSGNTHLSVSETLQVIADGVKYSFDNNSDTVKPRLVKIMDDTMFRLYDARSASAVMMNVPNVIPYHYGDTFLHMFYALIPRYFWPEKPSMADIHHITEQVMENHGGVCPTGTIAELYINFSFVGVLLGGLVCFWLCCWLERVVIRKRLLQYGWLCSYPIMVTWIMGANWNFTQRITEMIRLVIFVYVFTLFLRIIKKDGADNINVCIANETDTNSKEA